MTGMDDLALSAQTLFNDVFSPLIDLASFLREFLIPSSSVPLDPLPFSAERSVELFLH
jgi:hypothetical protein